MRRTRIAVTSVAALAVGYGVADAYDRYRPPFPPEVIERLLPVPGMSVLDVGAGSGWTTGGSSSVSSSTWASATSRATGVVALWSRYTGSAAMPP